MTADETDNGSHHQGGRAPGKVTVRELSHWYRASGSRIHALDGINSKIDLGEFVCVVGASGCGKTTWLKILAGFEQASEGQIWVGPDLVRAPDPERGVVFQAPNLFPWLSVEKNVSFGPRMRKQGRDEYEARVQGCLELVGLADFAHRRPYELSGGMQQRAAIARVLVNDPSIMLMDEPFGALDALTRERMQEELLSIWRQTGKTIFFITHSVEEAVYLGTRVLVMSPRPGRIILDKDVRISGVRTPEGSWREIRAAPEFVAVREEVAEAIYKAGQAGVDLV